MFFLITLFSFLVSAQNSALDSHFKLDGKNAPLTVTSTLTTTEAIGPGARIPVTISVTLAEGLHAYEDKFKLVALAPDGLQISDIEVRPLVEFVDFAHKKHVGLEKAGTLKVFVEIPQNVDTKLKDLLFELNYVACTQKVCLPPNKLKISVPVNFAPKNFMEYKMESGLWFAFLIVFVVGIFTSLTPCVYPLIPITLAVIGARSAKKSQAFIISVVYVLGIATTYATLGYFAAKTGSLFGQALSYPPVVIGFAVLFVVMALSLFGLFEIRAPHFITAALTPKSGGPLKKSSASYVGVYVAGLIAGIIASPCVGPVLVGILAMIAKSQNGLLGFFLLFTFALGMGVILIIMGTYSSLLKTLPRSGKWMDRIKILLGIAMLVMAFYYVKPLLPKIKLSIEGATQEESAKYKNGWQKYSEELVAKAKAEGKPVIIDFFADWCAACVELDEKTFSTPEFIEASKRFVLLKVDATENFDGLADLQKKYEVYGLPTIGFVKKDGSYDGKQSLTGFEEAPKFLERLKAF